LFAADRDDVLLSGHSSLVKIPHSAFAAKLRSNFSHFLHFKIFSKRERKVYLRAKNVLAKNMKIRVVTRRRKKVKGKDGTKNFTVKKT